MAGNKRTEYEIAIQVGGKIASSFGQSIQNINNNFDSITNMAEQVGNNVENSFENNIQNINNNFDSITNMAKSTAKMITAVFATVQVGQFIKGAVETYSEFEQSMANTAAVAKATEHEYKQLEDAAREMGKATTKTASEAADALGYMMLAGWDVNEAISGLEPVLRLSEATQMDLATCSDLVTDSMSALGLSVNELYGYLDLCTAANNSANTTAEALMEAFIGCGGAAKTIRADLNDTATALGVLANNGTKGAEAGTALNSMLVRMTSKDTALKAMKKLGVTVFDNTGKFRGLETVLIDLQRALSKLNPEKQASYMSKIAGTNYYTEMSYLLDAVGKSTSELAETTKDADGAWAELAKTANNNQSAWTQLSGKLEDSDGALLNMADTVTDTVQGAFSRLDSAVDDAKISFADVFADDLKDTINDLSEYIPTLTQKFIDFSTKAEPKISKIFQTITQGGTKAWEVVSGMGGWVIDNFDTVEKVIAGIGGAIITYKVISGLTGTAKAIKGVTSSIKAMTITNPWISGITLATSAILGIASVIKTAEKQAAKSNLAKHFGEIALSVEDISEVTQYLITSDHLSKIHESMTAFDELDGIANSMQNSIDAINKMNWKVSIGMELSTKDKESYVTEIQNYIEQAQDYVNQQQYALNINLSTFAEGDLERQNIVDQLNKFYSQKTSELENIGTKLNETVTEAFKDGLLDIDEAKEITELQAQMARIQETLATSDFDAKLKVMELQYSGAELDANSFRALQEELAVQVEAASEEYEESLQLRIANYNVMLEDGAINQTQYDAAVHEFWEDYLTSMSELETKSLEFQTNTIMQQYGEEIESFYENIDGIVEEYSNRDWEWKEGPRKMWDAMIQDIYSSGISKDAKDAVSILLESMEPSIEQIEELKSQFENLGIEIPQSLTNALSEVDLLSAVTVQKKGFTISGSMESVYHILGERLADDDYFQDMTATLQEKGYYIPDGIIEGMKSAQTEKVVPAIEGMYAYSNQYLDEIFSKGFDISTKVNVDFRTNYNQIPLPPSSILQSAATAIRLGGHAKGGIFDKPHIAWFAEDGPEAAIPLDGSSHAVSLWERVGQLLGIFEGSRTNSKGAELYNGLTTSCQTTNNRTTQESTDARQFVFSPQIMIEGGANDEDIKNTLRMSMEEFRELFEQYIAEKERGVFT